MKKNTKQELFDSIAELGKLARSISLSKGCDERQRPAGSCLMGISSELGEAYAALRKNKRTSTDTLKFLKKNIPVQEPFSPLPEELAVESQADIYSWKQLFSAKIKDSFEDELADTVIRLFNFCESLGVDLATHIQLKMFYNNLRVWRSEVDVSVQPATFSETEQ